MSTEISNQSSNTAASTGLQSAASTNPKTKLLNFRQTIALAMSEEMRRDEKVFLIGEDVGIYGGDFGTSVGMFKEFGSERVIDTPISEAAIMGAAVGAAMKGLRPIVDLTFMDFVTIAMDALVNQGAKVRYMLAGQNISVPLTIRCACGSGIGSASQHSQSLESWLCHIPGIKVIAPGTAAEMKGMLKSAIREDNIVVVLEYKAEYGAKGEVPLDPDYIVPLGKADIKREGSDLTIISYGRMLSRCLEAADAARLERNIQAEVVDIRTLVPLDEETILSSVRKCGRVLLVAEDHKRGSYIGDIAARIAESDAFDYLDHQIVRLAGEDVPIPYAHNLEEQMIPSVDKIKQTIFDMSEGR